MTPSPWYAGLPVRHSKSSAPSENTSARGFTRPREPCACSGAMYPGVPRTLPVRVRRAPPGAACARPKSSTFVASASPPTRKTLLGLMSRWTISARARRRARRRCAWRSRASRRRRAASREARGEALSFEPLHHEVRRPLRGRAVRHVAHDVGVAELGERVGLVIEAVDRLGVELREELYGDGLARLAIRRAKDGPHAARAGEALEDEAFADDVSVLHAGKNADADRRRQAPSVPGSERRIVCAEARRLRAPLVIVRRGCAGLPFGVCLARRRAMNFPKSTFSLVAGVGLVFVAACGGAAPAPNPASGPDACTTRAAPRRTRRTR